jgi:hypothetical protein
MNVGCCGRLAHGRLWPVDRKVGTGSLSAALLNMVDRCDRQDAPSVSPEERDTVVSLDRRNQAPASGRHRQRGERSV